MPLTVPSFGGGVVLFGSADAQHTDELQAADSYDIGPRGQLVAASDISNYLVLNDNGGSVIVPIHGMALTTGFNFGKVLAVGEGDPGLGVRRYVMTTFKRAGEASPYAWASGGSQFGAPKGGAAIPAIVSNGVIVTMAAFPGQFWIDFTGDSAHDEKDWVFMVNIGAREGTAPRTAPGLYFLTVQAFAIIPFANGIARVDALGTGEAGLHGVSVAHGGDGSGVAGTKAKQLYFRGIVAYNNHIFGWGFDNADATNGDGLNRIMFSNIGNPLKYGLDPGGTADRDFTDSDAFTIGGAGEIIRAGYVWAGKCWIGTNAGLHYIEGYGRESFLTNGAVPVRQSEAVIGPHAMIEGPDGLLYLVSPSGPAIFDGAKSDPIYKRLIRFDGKSPGYWDEIWSDPTRGAAYPGQTNQDLVWMLSDKESMQVWVIIPWCDATAGYGYGTDTVVIKYHVLTGGFTRQVFIGSAWESGTLCPRDPNGVRTLMIGRDGGGLPAIGRYGFKSGPSASPVMPTILPTATLGEYAPSGTEGAGVNRKAYLTLSWEAAASLPLVFDITPFVDGKSTTVVRLTIGAAAPVGPANGDLWVDTSGTDTNLGNGTAGSFTPASAADYLLKRWVTTWAKWVYVPGMGQQQTRISVPIAYTAQRGTRVKFTVAGVVLTGRYELEGLGFDPTLIRSDA